MSADDGLLFVFAGLRVMQAVDIRLTSELQQQMLEACNNMKSIESCSLQQTSRQSEQATHIIHDVQALAVETKLQIDEVWRRGKEQLFLLYCLVNVNALSNHKHHNLCSKSIIDCIQQHTAFTRLTRQDCL